MHFRYYFCINKHRQMPTDHFLNIYSLHTRYYLIRWYKCLWRCLIVQPIGVMCAWETLIELSKIYGSITATPNCLRGVYNNS